MNQPIVEAKNFDPAAETPVQTPPQASGEVTTPATPAPQPPAPAPAPSKEEPAPATDPKPGEPGYVDWKKRHDDSAREAQRLAAELATERQRREVAEAQAASAAELQLEADLRIEHPDWEVMGDTEKDLARTALREKRRREQSDAELASYRRKDEFERSFAALVATDEFKKLAGHKDSFLSYVNENPSTDIKVLARSFMFDKVGDDAAQEAASRASRTGLEAPSGSPSSATPKDGLSDEQLQALANTNPKEFARIMQEKTARRQAAAISGRPPQR